MPIDHIFTIDSPEAFRMAAISTFEYQYNTVPIYRQFCDALKRNPSSIRQIEDIPFIPISFFKSHKILATFQKQQAIFTSSGTTGPQTSKHYVADLSLYERSFVTGFESVFGNLEEITILALLPSYFEQENSSLLYMVNELIKRNPHSGFYLNNHKSLVSKLEALEKAGQQTLLIGVSYALLDLVETRKFNLNHTMIMETGGMKGRRKELVREELHEILKKGFGVSKIHSEYGMTELLSQAYSIGDGIFNCPPWMKIYTRDTEDALSFVQGKTGGINVIDLANYYSCSFIATQDLGKTHPNGSFEILGRFDNSDIRGCNLMVL